jgi:hypothetical protein
MDVKDIRTCIKIHYGLLNRRVLSIVSLSKIIKTNTKIERTKKYRYIDIGEISSPLYTYKEMYGWELSKSEVYGKKNDILISKLEGRCRTVLY